MQAVHHEQVANEIAALKAFASASFSGVVHYYGTFEEGDSLFLVLEHCDGGSAFDRMRKTLQGGADEAWLAAKVNGGQHYQQDPHTVTHVLTAT